MINVKRLARQTEVYVASALLLLCLLIQARSGQFFTGNNLVDITRSMITPALFSIGCLIVIISGGIDVSFTAVAALAMYATTIILLPGDYAGPVIVPYALGAFFGLVMGLINGLLIARFRFPALVVTLGTASLYLGIMQGVLAARQLPVPAAMKRHGQAYLFKVFNTTLNIGSEMPVTVFLLAAALAAAFFLLRYTMLGRGIFAVGGDEISAERAGFNVFKIKTFIYCFAGTLAGITGVARASMMQNCHPQNLNGMEMTVIAACVLGGARVSGGLGTLTGAMLGVALMTVMSNSLILLGIPTYWQRVFTGAVIVIGTGVSAYQAARKGGAA
ncbi:MAG: ABC transporter permease [Spirochaetaceae bacterium]|jgi:simple sugar transport system permease protein|nr:ABC transporter permease [Spirochaetaceae bacterium]